MILEIAAEILKFIVSVPWPGALLAIAILIFGYIAAKRLGYLPKLDAGVRHDAVDKIREDLTDLELRTAAEADMKVIQKEVSELEIRLVELQQMVHGAHQVRMDNIEKQISDLKEQNTRVNNKIEKLTDMFINYLRTKKTGR